MGKWWLLAASVAGMLVMALAAAVAIPAGIGGAAVLAVVGGGPGGACTGLGSDGGSLKSEQTENLQVIVETVTDRGLAPEDAVIAVMTALTESSLMNVDHGDVAGPDSRGLFQQCDSWGPLEVRMDPAGATGLFLDALTSPGLKVYGRIDLVNSGEGSRTRIAPWLVAQSVQRSAYADGSNYRRQYERAMALVSGLVAVPPSLWAGSDDAGNIGEQVGSGSSVPVYGCEGGLNVGGDGPGAWGGYENGRIPVELLTQIPWAPGHRLRADAVAALVNMNLEYRAAFGEDIAISDSYRDYDAQVRVKAEKGWLAATPGTSNHGWALAVDLGGGVNRFGTPQHNWMVANAGRFGWVHPSWAQQGGSKPEAWHWEFNGGTEA